VIKLNWKRETGEIAIIFSFTLSNLNNDLAVSENDENNVLKIQVLNDGEYGVAVKAVKLKREVEMFQWVEHQSTKYVLNTLAKINELIHTKIKYLMLGHPVVKKKWK
jgi:hypothetical protein